MSETTNRPDRRRFLKTAAVAGGAASVAAASTSALAAEAPAPAQPVDSASTSKGYHVTPHVETYYRLARD